MSKGQKDEIHNTWQPFSQNVVYLPWPIVSHAWVRISERELHAELVTHQPGTKTKNILFTREWPSILDFLVGMLQSCPFSGKLNFTYYGTFGSWSINCRSLNRVLRQFILRHSLKDTLVRFLNNEMNIKYLKGKSSF